MMLIYLYILKYHIQSWKNLMIWCVHIVDIRHCIGGNAPEITVVRSAAKALRESRSLIPGDPSEVPLF